MHVSLEEASPYAISNLGLYFSDGTIDTIQYRYSPLTYLNPQVENPSNNIIADTLNWVSITGTFVATGNEKYLVFGNFEPDATTTKTLVGNPGEVWSDYWVDDVSCIDTDLPAFAGNDTMCIPGTSVYIGRQRDVGIDEACMWYQLPNTSTAIDTAAGLWVNPVATTTYVVKQEICGNVKWDTVVVHQTALGLQGLESLEGLKVYPLPADEILNIESKIPSGTLGGKNCELKIYDDIGQVIREEEIQFDNGTATIKTKDLASGVYHLKLVCDDLSAISRRFVIAR